MSSSFRNYQTSLPRSSIPAMYTLNYVHLKWEKLQAEKIDLSVMSDLKSFTQRSALLFLIGTT